MGASTFDRNSRFEESRYERLKLIMTVVLTCVTAVGMGAFSRFTSQLNERALEFRLDSGPQSTLVFDRHDELISPSRQNDVQIVNSRCWEHPSYRPSWRPRTSAFINTLALIRYGSRVRLLPM
jgi:hypothetical protein